MLDKSDKCPPPLPHSHPSPASPYFTDQLSLLSKLASAVSPKSLKVISFADVQKHDSIDKGIWVTYRDGVYDITKFLSGNFCDAVDFKILFFRCLFIPNTLGLKPASLSRP